MRDQRNDRFDSCLFEPQDDRRSLYRDSDLTDTQISSSLWAWSAGVSAVLFIIAIVYGVTTRDVQTAFDRNAPRPATASSIGVPATAGFGGAETTGVSSGSGGRTPPQSEN